MKFTKNRARIRTSTRNRTITGNITRYGHIYIYIIIALMAVGCSAEFERERNEKDAFAMEKMTFVMIDTGIPMTKSDLPNENIISDLNLFIMNSAGTLEEKLYLLKNEIIENNGSYSCPVRLVAGEVYSIYAMANLGYQPDLMTAKDIESFRYYLSRPDDYKIGLPMSGSIKDVTVGQDELRIKMRRAMSKVTVNLDKSGLDDEITFKVTNVKVGNCPKVVALFEESGAGSEDEVFASGFARPSLPDNFFLCENRQPAGSALCSYIEIEAEYNSSAYYTKQGNHLVYRFYIGGEATPDVERNCHYTITVKPKGDGLGGVDVSDWRIDKGGLSIHYDGEPSITPHPSQYIECKRGDIVHVWCEVYPPDTDFDIGLEELEFDKERGIYDYVIDEDGHGVMLTMKNKGSGLLYMSAGEPVWKDVMFVVVCEP